MMICNRRTLLRTGSMVALGPLLHISSGRPLLANIRGRPTPIPALDDPDIRALVQRGIDAARSAGADYVDVRLTHERARKFSQTPDMRQGYFLHDRYKNSEIADAERLAVGIRVAASGYWGFASSPIWSPDELVRLGREAVQQAKTNALGKPRELELAPTPIVDQGRWTMPIAIDPFEVPVGEIMDYLMSLWTYVRRTPDANLVPAARPVCLFKSQQTAFGSSDGSYCTQQLYQSSGALSLLVSKDGENLQGTVDILSPAGVGWELYKEQPIREAIQQCLDEIRFDLSLPVKPVEVGRLDAVFDAYSVSQLLSPTIGAATELDRVMGYEGNAGGTSYINDPATMLRTYKVGAPLLSVTANRHEKGGAATVQWDDEGVVPEEFSLVREGILNDVSTTRESASWTPRAASTHALRSHGCAYAPSALSVPLAFAPNLVMTPGSATLDFDSLVHSMNKGLAFKRMTWNMDFQQVNGFGMGTVYDVGGGKRTARISGGGILFRAPELWRSLIAIGGAKSARRYGIEIEKGEPPQRGVHSVTAVPAVFKDVSLVDIMRKA